MTITTDQSSGQWRPLNMAEFVASPEAKLGGALAVIFWSAAAMVSAGILTVAGAIAFGSFFSITMISRMLLSPSSTASLVAAISMIPQVTFFVWAFVFALMTIARRPSTPKVASALIVALAATSIGAQIAVRYVIAQGSFMLSSQASLLPHILLEIALVAAFCGYMSDGRRPNIYYLKRVRA